MAHHCPFSSILLSERSVNQLFNITESCWSGWLAKLGSRF